MEKYHSEVVAVMKNSRLHSVPFFTIHTVSFTANMILTPDSASGHPRSGIHKHLPWKVLPLNVVIDIITRPLFNARARSSQSFDIFQFYLCDIILKYRLAIWFKNPHSSFVTINSRCSLPLCHMLILLPFPITIWAYRVHTVIKIARQAANYSFVTSVSKTKPAGTKPTQMRLRRNDDY